MIGYLDCSTGVSGDKFLGALLDAGQHSGRFTATHLADLLGMLAPEARMTLERVRSAGVEAVGVRVESASDSPGRTWASVRDLIAGTRDISPRVRDASIAVFSTLAEAEGRVHGCPPDQVHFHEVGAVDSILDVVGVCAGLEALQVERLVASPVATGAGVVATSHGVLGVPAPATALLLAGVPVVSGPSLPDGAPVGELTTPTGAALLAALGAEFGSCPPMVPRLVGFGAGTRDIGSPNVCRIVIGESANQRIPLTSAGVTLLETNIDHLAPEESSSVVEQLLAEGALDAWLTPIVMKKGRAAVLLSVLSDESLAEATAERVVALTGSLGVRSTPVDRYTAERATREVSTPWGRARVKVGPPNAAHRIRPEHEDVARIARENRLPYGVVRDEIARLVRPDAETD